MKTIPLSHSLRRDLKLRLLLLALAPMILGGCETLPQEYQGRPVVGVKWVEGKKVYLVGPKGDEKEEIERIAREGDEATAEVTFAGTKSN